MEKIRVVGGFKSYYRDYRLKRSPMLNYKLMLKKDVTQSVETMKELTLYK
jgi:hypothetical protein